MYRDLLAQATALADAGETTDALGRIFECDVERQEETLKKMLAWEAENTSQSGQVRAMLARSQADVVSMLDNLYSPSLHIASRKTIVSILSTTPNVRHPRYSALVAKIKAETDPELKEAGEELEVRELARWSCGGKGECRGAAFFDCSVLLRNSHRQYLSRSCTASFSPSQPLPF